MCSEGQGPLSPEPWQELCTVNDIHKGSRGTDKDVHPLLPPLTGADTAPQQLSTMTAGQFHLAAQLLTAAWQRLVQSSPQSPQHASSQAEVDSNSSGTRAPPGRQPSQQQQQGRESQVLSECSLGLSMLQSCWRLEPHRTPFVIDEGSWCLTMSDLPHRVSACTPQAVAPPAAACAPNDSQFPIQAPDDEASVPDQDQGITIHLYTLRIVLHPIYQVPTLYLCGHAKDGAPLSWQGMEADFPHWHQLRSQLGDAPWALMAPADEQVPLAKHGLMLHPCRTEAVMHLLLNSDGQGVNSDCQRKPSGSDGDGVTCDEGHVKGAEGPGNLGLRYLVAWLMAVVAPVLDLRLTPQQVVALSG